MRKTCKKMAVANPRAVCTAPLKPLETACLVRIAKSGPGLIAAKPTMQNRFIIC